MCTIICFSSDTPLSPVDVPAPFSVGPPRLGRALHADPVNHENHVFLTMATGPAFRDLTRARLFQVLPQDFVHLGLKEKGFCLSGHRTGRYESE